MSNYSTRTLESDSLFTKFTQLICKRPKNLTVHRREALNFGLGRYVRRGAPKWGSYFVKIRSKELKIFNILRAYELKFEQNLGCRAENSVNF